MTLAGLRASTASPSAEQIGHELMPVPARTVGALTANWGSAEAVSLYLQRCQVHTPETLVRATWRHALDLRERFDTVLDFGAGDGRFCGTGRYGRYIGYEIDNRVIPASLTSAAATIVNSCAFDASAPAGDLVIGNPPFVRNQDLPEGWKSRAGEILRERTGVSLSGLANAWQYFFLLSLASACDDGVVALVIPYEWVSRPSARALREHIRASGWAVNVYRLVDSTFDSVLTTSSITVVDKANRTGDWSYFEERADGTYKKLPTPTASTEGVLPYTRRNSANPAARARRGLSPGSQKLLVLSEGERVRLGLTVGTDVVRCITSLRHVPAGTTELTEDIFRSCYVERGAKCWLINTARAPSKSLTSYLDSVPETARQTATCLSRSVWWKFEMPEAPELLISMSFNGRTPKAVSNPLSLRAVGGVTGIYCDGPATAITCQQYLSTVDLRQRVVAYSHGLYKIEISQLNHLLNEALSDGRT